MTIYRRPVSFALELIRRPDPPRDLTIFAFTNGYETDLLIGASCVSAVRSCYFGLEGFGATGLNDLGWAEQDAGDLDNSEQHYRQALQVAHTIGYREAIVTNNATLAGLLLEREDWPAAETLAREALQLTEVMGHQLFIAYNCWRVAKALVKQGRRLEGLPYARRAVAIFDKLPSPEAAKALAVLKECEAV